MMIFASIAIWATIAAGVAALLSVSLPRPQFRGFIIASVLFAAIAPLLTAVLYEGAGDSLMAGKVGGGVAATILFYWGWQRA